MIPKIKNVFKGILGIKSWTPLIRDCDVLPPPASSWGLPGSNHVISTGHLLKTLLSYSFVCVPHSHWWSYIPSFVIHCIVTLRFWMKSVISRLETIDQLPWLLQLSQLNWVPFTYWSNIKAKEFIRYHCWHLKFSTIFVLLHIWMKEIKEKYIYKLVSKS